MADPKGFLKIPRRTWPRRPVEERVKDWNEVYQGQGLLPIISEQAERCMDCGIPFCHDSCPLGNLIPEWNDLVSRDDWAAASDRLHATNNFPEFTGRLCPAPCETACVLAINADPVTIKNVEAAIADDAWEHGYAPPLPPERLSEKRVAVIGSGPAGLACAQQLTRAGHTVTVYERSDRIGGLLRYGIPEFKMEKRHLDRRIEQMRAEGTKFRTGVAVGTGLDAAALVRGHDAVVVAVGATAWRELPVPGRELHGIHQAMEYLPMANRVCEGDFAEPPVTAEGKDVVIVGGGDTAADCLGTVLRQRAASVVQLDINPQPGSERRQDEPWPVYPKVYRVSPAHEEAGALARLSSADRAGRGVPLPGPEGDVRMFSASTLSFRGDADGHVRWLRLAGVGPSGRRPRPGAERLIPAQLVLLALGFEGPERDNGLVDRLGLRLDARGTIARDAEFATRDGIFVAGDAGRGQSLIVWAIAEGRSAAAAVDRYLMGATALPAPIAPTDRALVV
ncbi:glutamate synthase subunit beta [Actinacidiphila oryziradicis]|jgi:glutamate synthase (NADPH/NADH) small chain|uniref:Glutamate synthase subunit beta n=1 Tax=Actinacidiphila oryziradicis TaxID=2571141 RepID=A0A4U0SLV9_9ACTN|nr:glutamate synthase subunit beta [Actinacidiphila oryziradicis]MCW2868942.1 glutamate synthase, small subunit [Actinacidiphila oryziradicis]TKA09151.1 glutamate synthase subunit beta [Actinacidiphila oryziradicis]